MTQQTINTQEWGNGLQNVIRTNQQASNPRTPLSFLREERQLAERVRTENQMKLFGGGPVNKLIDGLSLGTFAQVAISRKVFEGAGMLPATDKNVWELMNEKYYNAELLEDIGKHTQTGGVLTGQYKASEDILSNLARELPRSSVGLVADIALDPLTYLGGLGLLKKPAKFISKKIKPTIERSPQLKKTAETITRQFVPSYLRQPEDLRMAVIERKIMEKEAMETAGAALAPMEGMSKATQQRVQQVIRGGITTKADIQDVAKFVRKNIDESGDWLAKNAPSILDETTYTKNKGTYLGTFYHKHADDAINPTLVPLKHTVKLPLDRTKMKKDFSDIVPKQVRDVIDSGPEVKTKLKDLIGTNDFQDVMKRTSSGIGDTPETSSTIARQLKEIFPNYSYKELQQAVQIDNFLKANPAITRGEFFLQGNFEKFRGFFNEKVRYSIGRVEEAPLPTYKTIIDLGQLKARVGLYKKIARNPDLASSLPKENWDKLPVDKALGELSGKYVAPIVMEELQTITRHTTQLETLWSRALRQWKINKTALNPATIARNDLANLFLLNPLGGLQPWRIDQYYHAFKEMQQGAPLFKRAERAGLELSSQQVAELKGKAAALYKKDLVESGTLKSIWKNVGEFQDKAVDFYGSQDRYFKYANFRKGVLEDGLSDYAAMQRANFYLINYADMPPVIEYLRRAPIGAPFVSFAYGVSLPVAKTLIENPEKLANFFKGLNAIRTLNPYKLDRDEIYKEQQQLPDWIKRKPTIRLPWQDKSGNVVYLDLEYLLPFNAMEAGSFLPQGPFVDLLIALTTNRDPFLGTQIVDDGDTFLEAAAKATQYVYRSWAPALAPGGHSTQRLARAIRDEPERLSDSPRGVRPAIADVFFGLRTFPINPALQAKRNAQDTQRTYNMIKGRINTIKNNLRRGFLTKEEADKQIQREIERLKYLLSQ